MANENEQIDDNLQNDNIDSQQQEGGAQQPQSGGDSVPLDPADVSKQLDGYLDEFIKDTARTPAQGKKQGAEGEQQQQQQQPRGQRQQPQSDNTQSQQRGQSTDRPTQGSPVQQTPRQFGTMFRTDQTGAVYDARGQRVAAPGLERRVFERIYNRYQGMENENAAIKQQLEMYEKSDAAARDAGLSIEERAFGTRLALAWKQDPAKTVNFLLQQAEQNGIDVSSIRQGGGSLDVNVIRSTLSDILKKELEPLQPLLQQTEQQRIEQEAHDAAVQEYQEFIEQFPDAKIHSEHIANIMQHTGWDKVAAWFALQTHAARNGWDLSKPLQQQAQASMARNGANGQNGQPPRPTSGGNSRLPPMNGRAASASGMAPAGSRAPAPASASWNDIIADVASEHGVDLQ